MPNKPFQRGDLIGHPFRDPALLKQALTHRSAGAPHNERLEFLGDSIVNMMAAEALYRRWPKADEGAMTRARAELVREGALAVIGRTLELGERLILGPGEMKSGGHRRDSILADAVEAVVAAIYLDAGFEACRAVVLPWFSASIEALPASGRPEKDPKTRLQEWLQARQKALPQYELVSESGDDHAKHFRVRCNVADPAASTEGEGASRRLAEQQAAAAVLEQLDSK
ncbi:MULTISPECIES: ribonuclease III [Stenotrophomonas]|uniref:ribonuclease III n=1 Tax=Stenotrophomonas TaxID=40323 RepID=UPI00021E1397|nr:MULTISPECIES: ribonuclease III [Stenotrophomonas]AEM52323.1 Ribonuclease 3 [Stenotrophomonas maltophilia JV3]ELK6803564.1 ribonuclease III [Stenotrophomonas maltophilia]MBA0401889.1 ribonuclease III [Stenotrophomonas maltophilia]MCU1134518.1 ribonuclease III [Stenotrophomonas maltophilia]MCU1197573.1 ribonuclease III [Stenotrophomonas maltophilia]